MNMAGFFFLVLFALAQNIDNFVLAAAYRLGNVRIPNGSNCLIAVLSGFATAVAATAGWGLGGRVAGQQDWHITDSVARGLLIMLGIWTLTGYFRTRLFPQLFASRQIISPADTGTNPQQQVAIIGTSEATIAATALAVDNLAPSFAFGLRHAGGHGSSLLLLSLLTAGLSVLLVGLGQKAAGFGRVRFDNAAFRLIVPELISALLII